MLIDQVQLSFYSSTSPIKIFHTMQKTFQVLSTMSLSPILSLSAFMVHYHPSLTPPNYKGKLSQRHKQYEQAKAKHEKYIKYPMNDYLQIWNDYFAECVQNGFAYQIQNTMFMAVDVKDAEKFLGDLKEQVLSRNNCQKDKELRSQKDLKPNPKKPFKIILANFGRAQLHQDPFQPKLHLIGIISGVWFGNHNWKSYNILQQSYPTEQELAQTDFVFLTGSSFSVNDNVPEVRNFTDIMLKAMQSNKNLKIVGLCFGHQLLAKVCGGKVAKRAGIYRLQDIKFNNQDIQKYKCLSPLLKSNLTTLQLCEFHSDHVITMPKNFNSIATSSTCTHQAMISTDQRMISFQFHPEYFLIGSHYFMTRLNFHAYGCGQISNLEQVHEKFEKIQKQSKRHLESLRCIRQVVIQFMNQ